MPKRKPYQRYTPEEIETARRMAEDGCTQREAAEALGCGSGSVSWLAEQHGIKFDGRVGQQQYRFDPDEDTPYARGQARLQQWKKRKNHR